MADLDISEVAERSGVPASTLRYYDEIGLIASVGRTGLKRVFDGDVLLQLKLIAMGKAAGFSLHDIACMFGPTGRPDLPRRVLHDKADALDRQIRELIGLRDTLRHVADCQATHHMACPTFRRLVELAGKHNQRRRGRMRKTTPQQ